MNYLKTKRQTIIKILHGKKTDYKDCEVLADDILHAINEVPPLDGECQMCGKIHQR